MNILMNYDNFIKIINNDYINARNIIYKLSTENN